MEWIEALWQGRVGDVIVALTKCLVGQTLQTEETPPDAPEKFWNYPTGAIPILALQAAALSEDGRLEQLFT